MEEKNREIYASDGDYSLYRLSENEKEEYLSLLGSTISFSDYQQDIRRIMWNMAMEDTDLNFSIYDNRKNYCGNVMLKHPEIGIDIVEKFRNQGIAPRAIKMLAKKACEDRPVKYFILRVSSKNFHSKYVIEKHGGIFVNSEASFFEQASCALKDTFGKELCEKIKELGDEGEICRYRYFLKVFYK